MTANPNPQEPREAARPFRIWVAECPFRKNGSPVLGSFGARTNTVVIMNWQTWQRLCETVPQLATTQFEVGTYE